MKKPPDDKRRTVFCREGICVPSVLQEAYLFQSLPQIGDDVFHLFQTHREAEEAPAKLLGVEQDALVIAGLREDQALVMTQGDGEGHHLQGGAKALHGLVVRVQAEGDHAAAAVFHLLLGHRVARIARQAGVGHEGDAGLLRQPFGDALQRQLAVVQGDEMTIVEQPLVVQLLTEGFLPFSGKNNQHGVEIYQKGRYFIMTGKTAVYDQIIPNQTAIDYVVSKYFQEEERDKPSGDIDLPFPRSRVYNPRWELPENGRVKLRPVYPRIPAGSRNLCLTSLAGMLHNMGYSKSQIYDEIQYANTTACDPSLDKRELRSIVNSVTRYKR